jgi:hypothetical protein
MYEHSRYGLQILPIPDASWHGMPLGQSVEVLHERKHALP